MRGLGSTLGPAMQRDGRFINASGVPPHPWRNVLRFMRNRPKDRVAWPREIEDAPAPPPAPRLDEGIGATLIGHSTVLLQVAGLNILTDPIWSRCAGPFGRLGPKRVRRPAIAFDELPPIDAVLLSHAHYDHLDKPTLRALVARDDPTIVMGCGVARHVRSKRCRQLNWGEGARLSDDVSVVFTPAEHFSARTPFDRNRALWGGFVIDTPEGRIFFAGDTAAGAHIAEIRRCFGPMTLSLIPIGAYEPRWFMSRVHMDPAEAAAASLTLESKVSWQFTTEPFA